VPAILSRGSAVAVRDGWRARARVRDRTRDRAGRVARGGSLVLPAKIRGISAASAAVDTAQQGAVRAAHTLRGKSGDQSCSAGAPAMPDGGAELERDPGKLPTFEVSRPPPSSARAVDARPLGCCWLAAARC
jgi:hypothetical protein